MVEKARPQMPV